VKREENLRKSKAFEAAASGSGDHFAPCHSLVCHWWLAHQWGSVEDLA
jgi:hypothetical protein